MVPTLRPSALHRSRRVQAASGVLAAAVLAMPAVALAKNSPSFKAHVPFSGDRTTDLRVGEPLLFSWKGKTITKVCWTPSPIQHGRCGTAAAAAAKAGTQRLRVTLDNGRTYTERLTIGPRATRLPVGIDEAGAAGAHVVEYRATCSTDGYRSYSHGTFADKADAAHVEQGDLLAAYYRAGTHTIQAMPYAHPAPAFYADGCLQPVR